MRGFGFVFYYFLKLHLFFTYRLYYRKFQLNGLGNVPKKGAVIFAPNHQNALVDSLLAGGPTWRCPHFLARADVFKKKPIADFLYGLKMLPVYRFRDGLAEVKKNASSFDASIEILQKGKSLLIFPEGNHNFQFRLRPLQKGIARIAFETLERTDFQQSLKIVPVGIQYEEHARGGNRVLVSFGAPIDVAAYQSIYQENAREGYHALLDTLYQRMQQLIVHIPEVNYDEVLTKWQKSRNYKSDLVKQLEADQEIVQKILKRESFLPLGKPTRAFSFRKLVDTFFEPIHFIPKQVVKWIISKKVKDEQFVGSVHMVLTMYLFPVFYLIAFLLVYLLVVWK